MQRQDRKTAAFPTEPRERHRPWLPDPSCDRIWTTIGRARTMRNGRLHNWHYTQLALPAHLATELATVDLHYNLCRGLDLHYNLCRGLERQARLATEPPV